MIDKLRNQHPIVHLCALLDVAKSGYQAWSVGKVVPSRKHEDMCLLAALKDLHTCKIVGWEMDSRMTQTLVADALRSAYWRKKPKLGLLHHSDRGSHNQ